MYHFGVKVSIVEPGFFKTAVTDLESIECSLRQLWERLEPETRRSYGDDFFHKCECGRCLSFPPSHCLSYPLGRCLSSPFSHTTANSLPQRERASVSPPALPSPPHPAPLQTSGCSASS